MPVHHHLTEPARPRHPKHWLISTPADTPEHESRPHASICQARGELPQSLPVLARGLDADGAAHRAVFVEARLLKERYERRPGVELGLVQLPRLDAGVGAQVQKRVRAAVQERRRGVTHELRRRARRCSRLGSPSRGERGRHQASHARRCCLWLPRSVLLRCFCSAPAAAIVASSGTACKIRRPWATAGHGAASGAAPRRNDVLKNKVQAGPHHLHTMRFYGQKRTIPSTAWGATDYKKQRLVS